MLFTFQLIDSGYTSVSQGMTKIDELYEWAIENKHNMRRVSRAMGLYFTKATWTIELPSGEDFLAIVLKYGLVQIYVIETNNAKLPKIFL